MKYNKGFIRKNYLVILGIFCIAVIAAYAVLSRTSQKASFCSSCHYITPFYQKWQTSTHNKVECLKCHDYGPLNGLANQLKYFAGTGSSRPRAEVPDAKCLQAGCHATRLDKSEASFKRGIIFDHKPHFTAIKGGMKLHCTSCHYDMVQGTHMAVSQDVCFLCHFMIQGNNAFAVTGCPSCHGAPTKPLLVQGKLFEHKKYLDRGIKCRECHLEIAEGDGKVPADRCYFCHIDRGKRYNDIEFVHDNHVTKRSIDCHRCHTRISHGKIKMSYKLM